MSKSAGGSRTTTKNETGFDAQTQEWIRRIFDASKGAAAAGGTPVDPRVTAAGDFFGNQMQGADIGSRALSGDPNALAGLMDPYQDQVIDASNADWARINAGTMTGVNDAATQAGAFGGSRHGVATGTALAQNNQAQAAQLAALRSSGFNNAMGRAGQLVNFGFGGAGGSMGVGQYNRDVAVQNSPMEILKRGFMGLPYGQTQYGSQGKTSASAGFKIPFFG